MEPTKPAKSEKLTNGVISNGTSGHVTNGTDVSAKNGTSNGTSESVTKGTHLQTPSIKVTNGNLKNHVINAEDNEIEEVTGKADIQIDGNLLKINRKGPVDWSDDEYEDDIPAPPPPPSAPAPPPPPPPPPPPGSGIATLLNGVRYL